MSNSSEPLVIMSRMVPATATADLVLGGSVPTWEVEVWGDSPNNRRRTYVIQAKDEGTAAFEGIRQFGEEMECLDSVESS